MKTIILAGGLGTRLQEMTSVVPKPMVEIGGRPILWHIMKLFSAYEHHDFVLALGYKNSVIKNFFAEYHALRHNLVIDLAKDQIVHEDDLHEPWKIELIDTGMKTDTGGRIKRLKDRIGNERFFMTYGDGISNVNLDELLRFHESHGKIATVTAVRPAARFGALNISDQGAVTDFIEKPMGEQSWINGGFMVLEPEVFDFIEGDHTAFEREPMQNLVKKGQLAAYKHAEFWQCMDTIRDVKFLNDLWEENKAPWKTWQD